MTPDPPDTKALRQMIFLGLAAFATAFVVTFLLLGLAALFFLRPDTGEIMEILHVGINLTIVSFIVGLALAAATVSLLSRRNFRRALYRCPYCDKPLKGIGILCDCPQAQALKV